ncbi:MAG: radical SAM protein, partial [Promethearchaeota archaeon]
RFLKQWQSNQIDKKIFDGWKYGIDTSLIHNQRGRKFDYPQYIANEGIIGFETHVGCPNKCPYCIEANTQVFFKKIPNIIEELKYLVNQGYNHFHTCDTEFNTNLNYSIEFCEALIEHKLNMRWALYMKPYPYNEYLFQVLHDSNAYLITLSVDSDERIQALNNYSYKDLAKIIEFCNEYEIDLAIDLLTGYPDESLESTKKCLKFFENNPPKTVGISFYYRIYKNTELAELIQKDPNLQTDLITSYTNNKNYLFPIFYNNLNQQTLEELISDNDLFRIAGLTPGVNYQL